MSSNISGFQGVNTPLQSMTNGKYTLADYTKMNTVFGARITALEKATAFNPNNVTIGGSLSIQPNSTQAGTLTVASNGTINGNLTVAKTLTVTQNVIVNGTLSVAGAITFNTLNANNLNTISIVNSGAITSQSVTATTLSGNGAAITGVNAVTATNATNANYVPFSGLTGIATIWNQNTTGNAATATTATNATNATNANYVPFVGLTGTATIWNQNTTGNAATATNATNSTITANLLAGTIGQIPYQSGISTTSFIPVGSAGQILTSQGAGFSPAWSAASTNDPTKMPLAGGAFTGPVYSFQQNTFLAYDQALNGTYTPALNIISLWDQVQFNYNSNCNLSMVNITAENAFYIDETRKITITKRGMAAGDYVVTLNNPPAGYLFYNPTQNGVSSTTLGLGVFSHTYVVHSSYLSNPGFHLISKV